MTEETAIRMALSEALTESWNRAIRIKQDEPTITAKTPLHAPLRTQRSGGNWRRLARPAAAKPAILAINPKASSDQPAFTIRVSVKGTSERMVRPQIPPISSGFCRQGFGFHPFKAGKAKTGRLKDKDREC